MKVRLEIPGEPVPKGRPRKARQGHMFTPERTRSFEELVAWHARAHAVRLGAAPLAVRIELWSTRPLAGDIDNYVKAVLDGLVRGGAMEDDRQVVSLTVEREVGDPRTVVHLARATQDRAGQVTHDTHVRAAGPTRKDSAGHRMYDTHGANAGLTRKETR
jgi:crossover junction endodeoxyribonuclease RusA